MKAKHLAVLKKEEDELKKITLDVQQSICDLKTMLDSNNVSFISAHKSRNAEFKKLSSKVSISLPTFSPKMIISENISEMFGSLSALSTTEEHHNKVVLDEPKLITAIQTGYDELFSVTCYGEDEIWTRGRNRIMKLYNLQGILLKSVQTKSGFIPHDMSVTSAGDLVYADQDERTVNIVENKMIHETIRLKGWLPTNIFSTSCGDLLVAMYDESLELSVTLVP
ncbi:uncharacterized protein LOC134265088 [Saccostrea cucullata]|uniref:uncharacterized protein LOC134265088 n=1 Tax=Saccostrea cuccullata TaxID=36930 RepID=UPI002ED1B4AD